MSARDAKNGFGRLLDNARSEPVMIEKHGRPVVVVNSVEEYDRLRPSLVAKREQTKSKRKANLR